MSEPREFKAVHMLRDAHSSDPQCFTQYTFNPRLHLIEHSAYLTEKEAKESCLDLIKKIHGVASSVENYDGDSFKMFNMSYIADLSEEFLKQLEADE